MTTRFDELTSILQTRDFTSEEQAEWDELIITLLDTPVPQNKSGAVAGRKSPIRLKRGEVWLVSVPDSLRITQWDGQVFGLIIETTPVNKVMLLSTQTPVGFMAYPGDWILQPAFMNQQLVLHNRMITTLTLPQFLTKKGDLRPDVTDFISLPVRQKEQLPVPPGLTKVTSPLNLNLTTDFHERFFFWQAGSRVQANRVETLRKRLKENVQLSRLSVAADTPDTDDSLPLMYDLHRSGQAIIRLVQKKGSFEFEVFPPADDCKVELILTSEAGSIVWTDSANISRTGGRLSLPDSPYLNPARWKEIGYQLTVTLNKTPYSIQQPDLPDDHR